MQSFRIILKMVFVTFFFLAAHSTASSATDHSPSKKTNSRNQNNNSYGSGNNQGDNGEGGGEFDIKDYTIEEICQMNSYPLAKCTCSGNPDLTPICDLIAARDVARKSDKTIYVPPKSLKYDRLQGILVMVASVVGIIGNALVIYVILTNWQKHNYCHKLIGVLAMSDIFFAILQFIEAIPKLWTYKWLYGLVMCKVITGVYNLSSWVSMGLILVITIERYYGVVHPFSNGIRAVKIYIMLTILIVTGIVIIIPMMLHIKIVGSGRCAEDWFEDPQGSLIYSWVLMFIGFLIPLVIICVLYGKIVHVLWNSSLSQVLSSQQQQIRRQANKRIVGILITVFASFVILVFPIRIIWLLADHGVLALLDRDTTEALLVFGLVPYSFHVAINPIIYSAIDRQFRAALRELFNNKRSNNVHTMCSSTNSTYRVNNVAVNSKSHNIVDV